jgi:hypothetical protein
MSVSIPANFSERLVEGLETATGRAVDREAVAPLVSEFLGDDDNGLPLNAEQLAADQFRLWGRTIQFLVAGEMEDAGKLASALDQNKPMCKLLMGLICLGTDKFKARAWLLQALQQEPELIFALANMGGTHLTAENSDIVSRAFSGEHGLVEAALMQSGIDPERYFAKPERIASTAQTMMIKGNGYIPFARSHDPYMLSIAHLQRVDLKGEAYQIVVKSGIKLHPEFKPYQDRAMKHDPRTREAVCLIDGLRRKMLKPYLKAKWGIDANVYLAFFGLKESDLMAIGFDLGPRTW